MAAFSVNDIVEVLVPMSDQKVWVVGKVFGFSADFSRVAWEYRSPDGMTRSGNGYFKEPEIRKLSAETAARIAAEQKAVADLRATLKPGDDVEVKVTIKGQEVWVLGKLNSVTGDTYSVTYTHRIGNQIWGGSPRNFTFPEIRQPAPEVREGLQANRDFEAKVQATPEVEVFAEFRGKKAWYEGTFQGGSDGSYIVTWQAPDGNTQSDTFVRSEIREPVSPESLPYRPTGNPDTEIASLPEATVGQVYKYRYAVKGTPFDTLRGFRQGPATHANTYSHPRQFFLSKLPQGFGIIWQDKADHSIHLTKLDDNFQLVNTVELKNKLQHVLAAATIDAQGNCYYLSIQLGEASPGTQLSAVLYKTDPAGQPIAQKLLNTAKPDSRESEKLDIRSFKRDDDPLGINVADMRCIGDKLGVILSRQRHDIHFGAIALVFDANTLSLLKNLDQTSGHSWGNILLDNTRGDFVGLDLGDNYPRGIHLHRFNADRITSRVVYTFKTEHGDKPNNPTNEGGSFAPYSEISTAAKPFYRWSNDNQTYTELGGIVEGNDTYTIVFVGEPYGGKALNNSRTGTYLNDARNIGLIQVKANFPPPPRVGNKEPSRVNVVTEDFVCSQGNSETGMFYDYRGGVNQQQNVGIVWLTNYQDKEQTNASRLKVARLGDGNILLLWETWTPYEYVNTYAMKITQGGQILTNPVALGPHVRLSRQDDLLVLGNMILIAGGSAKEQKLDLTLLLAK